MNRSAITLEVLPAGFGDCLLVSCPVGSGKRTWRMLIDTGPDETYPALRSRMLEIPVDQAGRRRIDLFVVTHIDHDHIGAASLLLNDPDLNLSFNDIWFNAPRRAASRGVAEGEELAKLLGAKRRALPWNVTWGGGPVCTPAEGGGVELTGPGMPRITLLSPTPERLRELYKVWAKELKRLRHKERSPAETESAIAVRGRPTLEALAARLTPLDAAVANGSSIAFLLEHRGASVLLGADAFPSVMVPALKALAKRRRTGASLKIDAFKLSHHGSSGNVTTQLLDCVVAKHYVFSTNNTYFNHPDDEAISRVILESTRPTLWFNYDTAKNRHWGRPALSERYGHRARYPAEAGRGVVLALPSMARAKPARAS
jgi:beta-lactamase superfamily II metal-dependent hydrolase